MLLKSVINVENFSENYLLVKNLVKKLLKSVKKLKIVDFLKF